MRAIIKTLQLNRFLYYVLVLLYSFSHALFVAIQDILTRFHRMRGRPTLWIPGTLVTSYTNIQYSISYHLLLYTYTAIMQVLLLNCL